MSEIIGLSLTSACPPHVSKRKLRNRRMQAVRNLNPGLQETPAPNSLACFPLTMTIWDQYLGSSEAHSWCLNPADMKLGRPVVTVPCQRYYRRLSMIMVIIMMASNLMGGYCSLFGNLQPPGLHMFLNTEWKAHVFS